MLSAIDNHSNIGSPSPIEVLEPISIPLDLFEDPESTVEAFEKLETHRWTQAELQEITGAKSLLRGKEASMAMNCVLVKQAMGKLNAEIFEQAVYHLEGLECDKLRPVIDKFESALKDSISSNLLNAESFDQAKQAMKALDTQAFEKAVAHLNESNFNELQEAVDLFQKILDEAE